MILVISMFYGGIKSDKMDNFDIQILSRLLNNCRESDRQIGRELGMSGGAVNSRTVSYTHLTLPTTPYV